jgi:hypothetical protein
MAFTAKSPERSGIHDGRRIVEGHAELPQDVLISRLIRHFLRTGATIFAWTASTAP